MKNKEVGSIIGCIFGVLKVVAKGETGGCDIELYNCECECGNQKMVPKNKIIDDDNSLCTCLLKDGFRRRNEDLTGRRFGKLIVLERAEDHVSKSGRKRPQWGCLCDCGNECVITGENLRSGNSQSCGCVNHGKRGLQSEDLTGKRFGKLTVLYMMDERNKEGRIQWWCECDCGIQRACMGKELKDGTLTSCGCNQYGQDGSREKSIVNKVFGRLTAIKRVEDYYMPSGKKQIMYLCICECGNEVVLSKDYITGNSEIKSCGCWAKERIKERVYDLSGNPTHGLSHHPIYNSWCNMKQRCYNPNNHRYRYYGARGITICDEWLNDFTAFYIWSINNGWEEGLSIDRIDNDKGYSPDNCRWADNKTQANNRSDNVYISINGETHTISEWCDYYEIENKCMVYQRRVKGVDEKELFRPKMIS